MMLVYTLIISLAIVFNAMESSGFPKRLRTKASSSEDGDDSSDGLTTPSLPQRKKLTVRGRPAQLQIGLHLSEKQHLEILQEYFNTQHGENGNESSSQFSSAPAQGASLPPHRPLTPRNSLLKCTNIESIRLIPNKNTNRVFELKEHAFPPGVQLELKEGRARYGPMKNTIQRVLITTDGVIFAIMQRNNVLRGIYRPDALGGERVKMNILTRCIEEMTPEEKEEVPLSRKSPIPDNFKVVRLLPCN